MNLSHWLSWDIEKNSQAGCCNVPLSPGKTCMYGEWCTGHVPVLPITSGLQTSFRFNSRSAVGLLFILSPYQSGCWLKGGQSKEASFNPQKLLSGSNPGRCSSQTTEVQLKRFPDTIPNWTNFGDLIPPTPEKVHCLSLPQQALRDWYETISFPTLPFQFQTKMLTTFNSP